jgi:hypothetical protein
LKGTIAGEQGNDATYHGRDNAKMLMEDRIATEQYFKPAR